MTKSFAWVLKLPFYPWLVGIYPILHLYYENLGLVIDHEVVTVVILMLAATSIAFLVTKLVIRCVHKSAFAVALCSIFFSLSGHVYDLAFSSIPLNAWTGVIFITLGVVLLLLYMRGAVRLLKQITATINLLALALVIWAAVTIAADTLTRPKFEIGFDSTIQSNSSNQENAKVNNSPTRPDIYYIIPDGYPSDGWLKQAMAYDNSDFSRALESRGFILVDHAQSNYGATLLTLASVLNMQLYGSNESPFADLDFSRLAIADNVVARQLRKKGYTFVQFLSGYLFPSPIADINRDFTNAGPVDVAVDQTDLSTAIIDGIEFMNVRTIAIGQFHKQSFIKAYVDTTLLRLLSHEIEALLNRTELRQYPLLAPERFLDTIDEIKSVVAMPEATFTMVHLMKPHEPVTFDALGNRINENWVPSHEQYFTEFEFTNSKFLQMIDTILEGSQHQPIIVFQADHGSTYGDVWTDDGRLVHFDIYSAVYLPDSFSIRYPQPFSTVNTFPLIFNEVFETDYPLRDDLLFDIPRGYKAPFEQVDVTDEFIQR